VSTKTWIIFVAVVAVLFGGLLYVSSKNSVDVSTINGNSVLKASSQSGNIGDHVFGQPNSKVVLVEYGDFQCPGCGAAYTPMKQVVETYQSKITYIFRNFPLTSMHPNALAAAAAVETAGLMGKYWQMHDKLYETQKDWSNATADQRNGLFADYAAAIGLDRNKFLQTLTDKNDSINQKISFDQALGKKAGVNGAPSFFVNGKLVDLYVKDGKLVPKNPNDSTVQLIWSDPTAFGKFVLDPALQKAGIASPSNQ